MEDDGFVDDEFIEKTAYEYVALHGTGCVRMLRQLAEAAARGGDELSAETWRAVAEAAGRMVGRRGGMFRALR